VTAAAGSDERGARLPNSSDEEALEDDPPLAHRDAPHPPGFDRLDVVRNWTLVEVQERL
jgi:hypothetical protein